MIKDNIGAFEAKTNFSKILGKVSAGKSYTITRRGKVIAKIIPFGSSSESLKDTLKKFRQIRERSPAKKKKEEINIKSYITEGRKY